MSSILPTTGQSDLPIGNYRLSKDASVHLYTVRHVDEHPIPKPLSGYWTSPSQFRAAAERYHGEAFTDDE